MMTQCIKKEDAVEAVWRILNGMGYSQKHNDRLVEEVDAVIGEYTAADVRPVVRGKWIQTTQPMGWRDEECAECSVCGEDFVLDEWAMEDFTNMMNFCPNCGASMKEES